jgi:N-methylhydantoinase A
VARLRAQFDAAHEQVYGYANSEDPVEVVNLRLVLRGVQPARVVPGAARSPAAGPDHAALRPVYFDDAGALDTPVFERAELLPGHRIAGPAIVEQLDATTVLAPGDVAVVDAAGNLVIDVAG